MPRLVPVNWRELLRRLRSLGFDGPFQGGNHLYMSKGDLVITLPNPHRGEISIDLLARVLRQADVSRKDWLRAP